MCLDWRLTDESSAVRSTSCHTQGAGRFQAINGLVHVRGNPGDYDEWGRTGATGWNYESLLPYFKKSEHDHRGETEFHGGNGPFKVERARWQNPLADAFIDAASSQLGIPKNDDFNSNRIEGAGYWDLATWNGTRTRTTCYRARAQAAGISVVTEALVTSVDFDGKRAKGVTYRRDTRELHVAVRRDVILSAGALHTPQLLQVSGIGPGALLQKHGIAVVHDLPGVGENLMDHVQYGAKFRTTSPHTLNKQVGSLLMQGLQGIRHYLLPRNGPLSIVPRAVLSSVPSRTARTESS